MRNRNRFGAVILAAAFLFTSFTTGCKPKKKNHDTLIKKCTSLVEDYMMYLTRGKMDKLSGFIHPDEDPLQNLSALSEPEQSLSRTYISLLEYSVGETTIEEDTATVIVTLTYPSAEKYIDAFPEQKELPTLLEDLRSFEETDEIDVEIILSCDEEEETCYLIDATTVNDVVTEQVSVLKDLVPDSTQLVKKDIDRFMQAIISWDLEYVRSHTDALMDYYGILEFTPFYTAETSLWTYEIECDPQEKVDEIPFTLHMHIRDHEAVKEFFTTPENLAPAVIVFYSELINPDPYVGLDDTPAIQDLTPGLQSYLEKAPSLDIDIHGKIQYTGKDQSSHFIAIDLSQIMPYENPVEFVNELTGEQIMKAYRAGYEKMYEDGRLTDEQYHEFQRALAMTDYDPQNTVSVLEKHGFTSSDSEYFDDTDTYVDEYGTTILVGKKGADIDAFSEMYIVWAMITDELNGDRDEFDGELRGDCLDMTFEGKMKIDTEVTQAYFRVFVLDEHLFIILMPDPTDKKMEVVNTILEEAGIN